MPKVRQAAFPPDAGTRGGMGGAHRLLIRLIRLITALASVATRPDPPTHLFKRHVPDSRPTTQDAAAAEAATPDTALLIVDMVSTWDFPDGEALLKQAAGIAANIAALKARCRAHGVPVIYANDNLGQWRSDFRQVVERAGAAGARGADITHLLAPEGDDYFVLKPKHSGFHATPLELLLRHLRVQRLIISGVAADQCVMSTAAEARMREWDVLVPADCVASQTPERNRRALKLFEDALCVDTRASTAIDWR